MERGEEDGGNKQCMAQRSAVGTICEDKSHPGSASGVTGTEDIARMGAHDISFRPRRLDARIRRAAGPHTSEPRLVQLCME